MDNESRIIDIGNDIDTGITIEKATPFSKTNIILDMSKFDAFLTCQYKYYIRYVLERARESKAPALDKGGLLHEGFEKYYSLLKIGAVHFNDRVQAGIDKIREISADPNQSNLEPEEVDFIVKTFAENVDYWQFEDEQLEILEVEQAFVMVIYEDDFIRIIISGKIDILCNYHVAGGNVSYSNLPIDHKSFSRSSETKRLTNQFQCYASAVGSSYLLVNKVGLQKSLKPEDKFKRVPLSYDQLLLDEWKDNVISVILDEYLQCIATGKWKQNLTSCDKYNRTCEYYEVCDSSGKEAKLYKLNHELGTASPWDVTAKLVKR